MYSVLFGHAGLFLHVDVRVVVAVVVVVVLVVLVLCADVCRFF